MEGVDVLEGCLVAWDGVVVFVEEAEGDFSEGCVGVEVEGLAGEVEGFGGECSAIKACFDGDEAVLGDGGEADVASCPSNVGMVAARTADSSGGA